jgi:hypothetical protein
MANLTPTGWATLRQIVPDIEASAADILTFLRTPSVANTAPRGFVLRKIDKDQIVSLLSPESQKKLLDYQNLPLVEKIFDAGVVTECIKWVYKLVVAQVITPEERDIVATHMLTPIPDPNYVTHFAPDIHYLGRIADLEDVAVAKRATPPTLDFISSGGGE